MSFLRRGLSYVGGKYPRWERRALIAGLLPTHQDYEKFIILGRSRTGSNFLRGLLNGSTGVQVLGEILSNPDAIEWGTEWHYASPEALELFQHSPVDFLEQEVFGRLPLRVQAFGFKLFYYHARTEPWDEFWSYLRERTDVCILHIKRRNILRTHLSRARAGATDQWVRITNEDQVFPAIHLDYQNCLEDFEQTRRWEWESDEFFKYHPKIDIFYEDLSQDHLAEMRRVQHFLGLREEATKPQTLRQAYDLLSDAILNYDELRYSFRGTVWEEFFEDEL